MKKNWEKEGQLEGLTIEEKEIISSWFNQIDFDDMLNERAKEVITAVLRHIYHLIAREKGQNCLIREYPKKYPVDEMLAMVDVKEVADTYDNYCEHFEPEGEKWLTSLDSGAELTVLFCENYVMSLIVKIDKS
jgi:hypothetical protein